MELPKAYNPKDYEDRLYKEWEDSGLFNPDTCIAQGHTDAAAPAFTIVLPPPNVTGTLHAGHAATVAIEDLMVRYHRMKGDKTLWIPGTDHAAIATQAKVEDIIYTTEKKTRYDLGREELLRRVNQFAQESHDTIVNQVRKMGASIDWSREAYTLDAPRHRAVFAAFKRMYDDGLIYRGYRTVNWSVKGQSTLSDDEVEHVERDAVLYTFKYSKDFPITIATTRPETKLGDTAVAVNPKDTRYAQYVGTTITVDVGAAEPLQIRVIADEEIDMTFGTGAVGVTPAHSQVDYKIAQKHKLDLIPVIGNDGKMLAAAGKAYAGLTVKEAREKFVTYLKENGLLVKEEPIKQNVGISDRYKDVVEVIPMTQWFIDGEKKFKIQDSKIPGIQPGSEVTLKELMLHVVRTGQVTFVPERFEKTYYHWIENLQPWCISRQIWFGHQIPVWYKTSDQVTKRSSDQDEIRVSDTKPGEGWTQDPDTLDTWFSAGLWTFSTLGWPEETADLKTYHPTSVLETGYDIMFFWVARMILMSTYLRGEVPFKTVYMHGLVRDEQGRKMSKSLGNVINPLDVIGKFGTDALRLSLVIGSTPGNDVKLSEEKIGGFKNFTNKLWNISRFILLSIGDATTAPERPEPQTLADDWILSRLDEVATTVMEHIEKFQFSLAGEALRDFTWNELADWYLEVAKIQMSIVDSQSSTREILNYVLVTVLKLWHPFMPFVTEAIWKEMGAKNFLMVERLPEEAAHDGVVLRLLKWLFGTKAKAQQFELVQEVITAVRALRAEQKIEPAKKISAYIAAGTSQELLKTQSDVITTLARLETLEIAAAGKPAERFVSKTVGGVEVFVIIAGAVDEAAEHKRLTKELEQLEKFITALDSKLSNQEFTRNAPKHIVDAEQKKLADAKEKAGKIRAQLQ